MKTKLDMIEMQAFPCFHGEDYRPQLGLTKREYFAGLFMQSLILHPTLPAPEWKTKAVFLADELINELNNETEVKMTIDGSILAEIIKKKNSKK